MIGICGADLDALTAAAVAAPRRRRNLNLHDDLDDPVQRLCNALEPDTYIRPHRHREPGRWELFAALRGAASVLLLDPEGQLRERLELAAEGPCPLVEIPAGAWHTVVAQRPGTVLLEVKPGPYRPLTAKDFAAWAPPEDDPLAPAFLARLRAAAVGDPLAGAGA